MGHFFHIEGIVGALAIIAQAWALIQYLYKRARQHDIAEAFIRSVAINHLPHIQQSLEIIARKVGVDLPPNPPIQFVELDEPGKSSPFKG